MLPQPSPSWLSTGLSEPVARELFLDRGARPRAPTSRTRIYLFIYLFII